MYIRCVNRHFFLILFYLVLFPKSGQMTKLYLHTQCSEEVLSFYSGPRPKAQGGGGGGHLIALYFFYGLGIHYSNNNRFFKNHVYYIHLCYESRRPYLIHIHIFKKYFTVKVFFL